MIVACLSTPDKTNVWLFIFEDVHYINPVVGFITFRFVTSRVYKKCPTAGTKIALCFPRLFVCLSVCTMEYNFGVP